MSVVTQLCFQIVEHNNYMFRPFFGWAIIRLRLEYRRNTYTTMWTSKMGKRDLILQCLGRCVAIYARCGICDGYDILVSTWWWPIQKRAETCSCFLQQFENTVVLRRTFVHLISTIIESHNGDDATKDWLAYIFVCWTNKTSENIPQH
jgi:hypothetical protein